MGIIWAKIFPPKEDNSAAVKKQAEGASNPMYSLASLVSKHIYSSGNIFTVKIFEVKNILAKSPYKGRDTFSQEPTFKS